MGLLSYIETRKDKNSLLWYNIKNLAAYCIPDCFYRQRLAEKLALAEKFDREEIELRVAYYNKLARPWSLAALKAHFNELRRDKAALRYENFAKIKDFTLAGGYKPTSYYFDTYRYARYFDGDETIAFHFADVTTIPKVPEIVKSRPIGGNNENSVVLKLDKRRHFYFVKDRIAFCDKENMLIGRGAIHQRHRVRFYERYFGHPLCDLGNVGGKNVPPEWNKGSLPIGEHLRYKFILCLEGNDVATNLKWVLSSNSVAVMPRPKYETWFMEGKLQPDRHYIAIRDDYSDLEEKLQYYIRHTDEALEIVKNAHVFVDRFREPDKEDLCSLLVLKKYLDLQTE